MNNLDEYIQDKETLGAEKAFKKWEIPSRTLAYDLFYKAQFEGKSIIIDMGCAREENHQMLIALKEAGYKIHMTHIICDADVALERIQSRERFTPIDMVYKRAMVLDTLIPSYKALADTFEEFDNTPFREDIAITQ